MLSRNEIDTEKKLVEEKINDSIGWPFPEKNINRLINSVSHDSDFFIFHPDANSTVKGYEQFEKMIDVFKSDDVKPTNTEIKDLKINLAQAGNVAWFSCILDDQGFWKGKPYNWLDARWTGVLEKRDGEWKIVQMHFSLPSK